MRFEIEDEIEDEDDSQKETGRRYRGNSVSAPWLTWEGSGFENYIGRGGSKMGAVGDQSPTAEYNAIIAEFP